jgi:putative tRNA adenosine deaminase-associated protein
VSYFAAAVVREPEGWSASELSLADAADLEDVADRLRDLSPLSDLALLFVESDDAYLSILRLDGGEDLRVFASDIAFSEDSRLGALLLGEVTDPTDLAAAEAAAVEPAVAATEEEDRPVASTLAEAEPAGDAELLADLGVSSSRLLALCAQDGLLPSDITAEVCQAIGCGDEVEELREA